MQHLGFDVDILPAEGAELTAGDTCGEGKVNGDVPGCGFILNKSDNHFLLIYA